MNTLMAILLYMQVIQSPGVYTQAQIDQLQLQYQLEIQIIMNDNAQMHEVNSDYLPQVPNIVIIHPDETRLPISSDYFMCVSDNKSGKNYQ